MAPTLAQGATVRSPLDLVQSLLAGEGSVAPSILLRDLAETFQADGAGLAETNGIVVRERLKGVEPALPWADDPEVRKRPALEPTALVHARGNQHFLLSAAGGPRVLWLEKAAVGSPWDATAQRDFGLIGLSLARRLDGGGASVQTRLDDAVHVARRLAHVYSNVLTSVLGFLEMSLTQAAGNPTLRRYLEVAYRGTQQGVTLTTRLRLLGCKATASAMGAPLMSLIGRQAGKRSIPGREVEEILDVAPDLPLVALSTEQVTALLDALLDNAHEAIEQKGSVTITARLVTLTAADLSGLWGRAMPGLHVRLDIADTGVGIGADARARLFREPFFSVKPRHHGLGLTIVHSILSSQNGGICLLDNPGGGVLARVLLPASGDRRTMA